MKKYRNFINKKYNNKFQIENNNKMTTNLDHKQNYGEKVNKK